MTHFGSASQGTLCGEKANVTIHIPDVDCEKCKKILKMNLKNLENGSDSKREK